MGLYDRLQAATAHCTARQEVIQAGPDAQGITRSLGHWTFLCCLPRGHVGPHRHEEMLCGGRLEHWAQWEDVA